MKFFWQSTPMLCWLSSWVFLSLISLSLSYSVCVCVCVCAGASIVQLDRCPGKVDFRSTSSRNTSSFIERWGSLLGAREAVAVIFLFSLVIIIIQDMREFHKIQNGFWMNLCFDNSTSKLFTLFVGNERLKKRWWSSSIPKGVFHSIVCKGWIWHRR